MSKSIRNDDLSELLTELGQYLRSEERGIASGWLHPRIAWAFYQQNGVIRQLVNRFATLMTKAGWNYKNSDVQYNWASVQSDLESLGLKRAMRSVAIWTFVFGGGAIFYDVDDGFQDLRQPLELERVRSIRKIKPMSAYGLVPHDGRNYATCELFQDRTRMASKNNLIHRSRLGIVVSNEVPPGIGYYGESGFLNTSTGWPPSWIESVYESFCDWKDAERNVSTIIRSKSLLYLQLQGFRKAARSPDSTEAQELQAYLQAVAENMGTDSLLTLEPGDSLKEVGRTTTGMGELLEGKRIQFTASTGTPKELVLMEAVGNLGDNSGPIDAFNDVIDGMREDMLTSVVVKTTDIDLAAQRYTASLEGKSLEIPSQYTTDWLPVAEQSGDEKAKQRKDESAARKSDAESGLPPEVIFSDPALARDYPDLPQWLEEQAELREKGKQAEGDKPSVPAGELESAASIAKRLSVSPSTIHKMIQTGKIEGTKVGSRWKLHWPSVWEAIKGTNAVAEAEEAVAEEQDRLDRIVKIVSDTDEWTVHNMLAHPLMAALEQAGFCEAAEQLHELTLPEACGELSDPYSFAYWLAAAIERLGGTKAAPALGLSEADKFGSVFGASTAMREIFYVLERVAPSPLSVLITGESGTGKEGIAQGLHSKSGRAGSFIPINCAALSYEPKEAHAELAEAARLAAGGSLFLDEIGELGQGAQAALLRVLGPELGDVRVISATWQDTTEEWRFRLDLRNRIAGVEVEVPPLRDREDDVLVLGAMFYAAKAGPAGLDDPFAPDAKAAMLRYSWPGNVRELKNAVERGALFAAPGQQIAAEHLQLRTGSHCGPIGISVRRRTTYRWERP